MGQRAGGHGGGHRGVLGVPAGLWAKRGPQGSTHVVSATSAAPRRSPPFTAIQSSKGRDQQVGKRAPPLHNTTGPSYHVTLPERDRTDSASGPAPPGAEVISIPAESAALSSPPPREDPGRWGEPRCPPPQIRGRRAAPIPLYLTPVGVSCTHSPQPPSLSIISLQARGADPPTSPAPFSSISSPFTPQNGGGCPHNPPHPPRPIPTENRKRHNPPPPLPPLPLPLKAGKSSCFQTVY